MDNFLNNTFLNPPIVAFFVAWVLTLSKVNLRIPENLTSIASTFLLLGIGLKGGRELSEISINQFWKPLTIVIFLGFINPLLAFLSFRLIARIDKVNSVALAAHYGAPSLVTFMVLLTTLDARGIEFGSYAPALFACLELLGIIVALSISKNHQNTYPESLC